MHNEHELQPFLQHVEPILPVRDIAATLEFWTNKLGFSNQWTWGEPPVHAGISRESAFIQFHMDEKAAIASAGNGIWIRTKHIESLYAFHQKNDVEIIEPLQERPWKMNEYAVKDNNGYMIIFSEDIKQRKVKTDQAETHTINIIHRSPSPEEYLHLIKALGWYDETQAKMTERVLRAAVFAVTAVDETSNEIAGCALVLGDDASVYYVKDVFVHPKMQGQQIGTKMMRAVADWLDANAPEHAVAVLITSEELKPFYQQFNFQPATGMVRTVQKNKK